MAGTKAKGKINSRAKGCRGEREACELLRSFGIAARRGQQFKGTKDSPDVVTNLTGWHCEVKRVESFNAYKAVEQAQADMGAGEQALVLHKRNGKPWLIVATAESILPLLAGSVGLGLEKRAQGGAEVAKTTVYEGEPNEFGDL